MTSQRHLAEGEYYHLYNRGVFKQNIFKEQRDYARFLFYVLYTQSPIGFTNTERILQTFSPELGFIVDQEDTNDIIVNRTVELTAFCLMPNHFHLIVKEKMPGGIASYMQRVGTGYTKYFNTKYTSSGRVFESVYKAKHVADNNYLLYLSAYIHRNPRELKGWTNREFEYPWSSLQDFTEANRWGGLLMSDIIADQFETTSSSNYKDFVKTSTAKIIEGELGELPTMNA